MFTAKDASKARDLIQVLEEAKQEVPPKLRELAGASYGGGGGYGGERGRGWGQGDLGLSSLWRRGTRRCGVGGEAMVRPWSVQGWLGRRRPSFLTHEGCSPRPGLVRLRVLGLNRRSGTI